jgi:uncharacterized OB-fold protein
MTTLSAPTRGRLVDESLFTEVDRSLRLVGSACDDCGTVTFPRQTSCPKCTGQQVRPRPLAAEGTLWAYTVQGFPPKTPYLGAEAPFRPFGLAYVDLAGEVLVESRLTTSSIDDLRVGLPMRLVLEPVPGSPEDEPVWTYAFAPSNGDNGGVA